MTFDQFIAKWLGKCADWDNYYGGQCVDLFRYYCDEVLEIDQPAGVWGAANFWTNFDSDPVLKENFDRIENTLDFVPQKGDVMVWNFNSGGGYGHIGMVIEATQNKFTSLDQNWPTLGKVTKTGHYYTNVYGVLRPKTMQDNQEELDKLRLERDKNWDLYQDEKTKTKGLQEEIERQKAESAESYAQAELRKKELQKFIEDLAKKLFLPAASDTTDIISGVERLLTVEDQLNSANKKIMQEEKKHEDEKSDMQREIDALKAEIAQDKADRNATEKKLLQRIESLENRLNENESSSDAVDQWKDFIEKLLNIFKRK